MSVKAGIILGGGGAKGAYQVGVWRALDKLDVCRQITGVSGTSAGALNGAAFCTGSLSQAIRAWSSIDERMILQPNDIPESVLKNCSQDIYNGWFSNSGIKELIHSYADLSAVSSSNVVFYATASRIKKPAVFYRLAKAFSAQNILNKAFSALFITSLSAVTTARYFKVNDYDEKTSEDIILASSAIPLVFPDITIDSNVYVDGGLNDNVPILPLYRDGYRQFLVINLDSDYQLPVAQFPDARFLHFFPEGEENLKGLIATFNFTPEAIRQKMRQGYDAAMSRKKEILAFFHN